MRIAILSDVHGNRHALEAVLADVRTRGADELWCLGDLVGYGADPDACVALVTAHCAVVLAGNHDLAVTGALPIEDFSHDAARAARWTRESLAPDHLEALEALRPTAARDGIGLFHASPRDPVWEYVVSELVAELCLDAQDERVCLVGHSHVALSFSRHDDGRRADGAARAADEVADLSAGEWLVNPGSVGQPRDGDPRAAWLELDTERQRARWRRVAYDVAGAQAAIREAGLPPSLAQRLGYGQ
jgi:diadenosine tetraphosphatase ApaH/serine/threonine PP2A family protein phosphatase